MTQNSRAASAYGAIVIIRVVEHITDYPKVKQQLLRLVRPGGRVFIDTTAFRENHVKPTLSRAMTLRAIMPTSACAIFWPRLTISRWTLWRCITIATIINCLAKHGPKAWRLAGMKPSAAGANLCIEASALTCGDRPMPFQSRHAGIPGRPAKAADAKGKSSHCHFDCG
jgi:hypothetical protein